jgi:uncharacterized protein (UPF0335 family)
MILKLQAILFFLAFCLILLFGCSASTASRYEKAEKKPKEVRNEDKNIALENMENFDMKPYRTIIELEKKDTVLLSQKNLTIWYEYQKNDSTGNDSTRTIIDRVPGYRVQVYSTDNLEDANNKRSEVYFKTDQKNVYVIFDPPFYKVEVGDFTNLQYAKDLNFKLNQLGFTDSHVVNDTVNVYE